MISKTVYLEVYLSDDSLFKSVEVDTCIEEEVWDTMCKGHKYEYLDDMIEDLKSRCIDVIIKE